MEQQSVPSELQLQTFEGLVQTFSQSASRYRQVGRFLIYRWAGRNFESLQWSWRGNGSDAATCRSHL